MINYPFYCKNNNVGVMMQEATTFFGIVIGGLLMRLIWMRIRTAPPRFRKKPVLTGSDLEFFGRLRRALPDAIVCPQIAVSALVEPAGIGRLRQATLDYIDTRKVGYAVFDTDLQLLAVIELDHRSRLARQEKARDAYFAAAGIRTVRFHVRQLPTEAAIHQMVYARTSSPVHERFMQVDTIVRNDIEFRRAGTPWRDTLGAHL